MAADSIQTWVAIPAERQRWRYLNRVIAPWPQVLCEGAKKTGRFSIDPPFNNLGQLPLIPIRLLVSIKVIAVPGIPLIRWRIGRWLPRRSLIRRFRWYGKVARRNRRLVIRLKLLIDPCILIDGWLSNDGPCSRRRCRLRNARLPQQLGRGIYGWLNRRIL